MSPRDVLAIALRALQSHKMRSSLTMLGLVIGVAAVILLTAFGDGVGDSVNAAIAPVANSTTIVPKLSPIPGGPSAKPLTDADEQAIAQLPGVSQLVPTVTGATVGAAGQKAVAVTASTPDANFTSASVIGTTYNFLAANQKTVAVGSFFDQAQDRAGAKVAVLGPLIAQALYGPDPSAALNKTLRLNHVLFTVIGVMPSYGKAGDNVVVMPMGAARSGVFGYGYGGDEVSSIVVKSTSTGAVKQVEAEITQLMDQRHNITDPRYEDFQVQDLGSRLTTFTQLIQLITNFVPAIAAISLLVGGIGVLNIMLVSVTDRTREIGTRKAVGASDSAILSQFVLEAVTLAGFGGMIGVGFGVGLIMLTKALLPLLPKTGFLSSFDPVLAVAPIAVAFVISLAIGLIAGGYPAWRAARLEPIEALRYE
ncbi:ABC transporter permease [Pseudonocardia spinosispora]|uniref:ABC transporter permease n=1 Tax=Pseudonocardia spinosispora TaxID=103441 RepID=UPI00040F2909|nr:ABC transporter permease [Pseudonocardia spinosispora]